MKALEADHTFRALAAQFALAQVDTKNGRSEHMKRLDISRNNAYFLILDPTGLERVRLMDEGGESSGAGGEELVTLKASDVIAAMRKALETPTAPGRTRLDAMLHRSVFGMRAVRREAADDLGRVKRPQEAVPALIARLTDTQGPSTVAEYAARSLGLYRAEALAALPALRKLALEQGVDARTREAALIALGRIVTEKHTSLPTLQAALIEDELKVVLGAAIALTEMGARAAPAVPQLMVAWQASKDPTRRVFVAHALGSIGSAASAARPLLEAVLKHDSTKDGARVADAARHALGQIAKAD